MNRLIFIFIFVCFTEAYSTGRPFAWIASNGESGPASGTAVAIDRSKNIYTCGKLSGPAVFGSFLLNDTGSFFCKYNSLGDVIWAKAFKGIICSKISVDLGSNVYITGSFYGERNIEGTAMHSAPGKHNLFISKFDSNGLMKWTESSSGPGNNIANSIINDYQGNTYITGSFENYMNLDTATSLLSSGKTDMFIAQYDSLGQVKWADKGGGDEDDAGMSLAVDLAGHVYLAGCFSGTAAFYHKNYYSKGGSDIYITRYNSLGLQISMHTVGGNGDDKVSSIGLDGSGNIFIGGDFTGTTDFDGYLLTASKKEAFVAMFDNTSGKTNWVTGLQSPEITTGKCVSADATSNVFFTGEFSGTAKIGGNTLTSSGSSDIFIAKIDASGRVTWVYTAGGEENDSTSGIFADTDDIAYITGSYKIKSSFGNINLTGAGNSSFFLAKMEKDPAVIRGISEKSISVKYYPNPSESVFHLYNADDMGNTAHICISDALGKIIKEYDCADFDNDVINLYNQPSGLYFARIKTEKGVFESKLIKQ